MQVEPIDAHVLPVILDWWQLRGLGDMPADVLPPVGYVASDEEGPMAAAWIYQPVGCKVAMIDWLVTRPFLGYMTSRAACHAVWEALEARARTDGALRIFASVGRCGMLSEAQACGFHVAAHQMIHLVKPL